MCISAYNVILVGVEEVQELVCVALDMLLRVVVTKTGLHS